MSALYKQLSDAVLWMDEEKAREVALEIVNNKLDVREAIEKGVTDGMIQAGILYDREEYFISELLSCADAMKEALQILKPELGGREMPSKGRIVIGTVAGDTHDIGKNIVSIVLEGGGFSVLDLGRDISAERFVQSAIEYHADIIAISSLMTTTMGNMRDVITRLIEESLRERFYVIVGGKPLSLSFAKKIGADGYSASATGALKLCNEFMVQKATNRNH
jgi:Predicted cobalamin binding protein